jgi:hypothetical protein
MKITPNRLPIKNNDSNITGKAAEKLAEFFLQIDHIGCRLQNSYKV